MVGERKAKRKAARLAKKQRKRENGNRWKKSRASAGHSSVGGEKVKGVGTKTSPPKPVRSKRRSKRKRPSKGEGSSSKQSRFEELLAEQNLLNTRETGVDRFVSAEDAEIEYLENKLGLGKQRKKANVEKSWTQLEKDLAKDGFNKGMAGFLRELDEKDSDDEAAAESSAVEDESMEPGYDSAESAKLDAEETDGKVEVRDRASVMYLPKRDLYGKAAAASSVEKTPDMLAANARIKRRLKGLLNRLAESNISPICTDILGVYKVESRREVTENLCSVMFEVLETSSKVLQEFAKVFAALVAALGIHLGQEVTALVLEKLVHRLEEVRKEEGRKGTNLAVLLAYLFLYDVVTSILVYGLLDELATTFSDDDIHILSVVTDYAGFKLRSDDPGRLKVLIEKLQRKNEVHKSAYTDFLLQKVYELKNNRVESSTIVESIQRLRKWLQLLRTEAQAITKPLEISYEDFKFADSLGRWWVVGGVWHGQQKKIRDSKAERIAKKKSMKPINKILLEASAGLLEKAKAQRMNTELRRCLFCVIMSSNDYVEAFQRLVALNLREFQSREIVHVLIRCCGSSRNYNPYFAHLSQRLCEHDHNYKFTYQLAFWDIFKQLEEIKSQRLLNLAELLAHLVVNYSLSLSVLKVVDFSHLSNGAICFFNAFFYRLLLHGGSSRSATRTVLKVFMRLGRSSDFQSTSSGIELFFHHHLYQSTSGDISGTDSALLRKRCKAVKEVFDVIATSQNDSENSEEPFGL